MGIIKKKPEKEVSPKQLWNKELKVAFRQDPIISGLRSLIVALVFFCLSIPVITLILMTLEREEREESDDQTILMTEDPIRDIRLI